MDVADILQNDLKDPRLGMVTCTRVDLTKDLRHAKVYVSVLGEDKDGSMQALESATGYVRRKLSRRLRLRVSPEIVFVFDPSVEYSIRLEGLIEETKRRSPPSLDSLDDGDGGPDDL
ncbi:MAG: 30S ribosome-binding factor RbfA [Acidobacteriota bacterium]|nr:MAG: 30S ribosome-binding factor RbfA [Acidobacteriota bacterium]